MARKKTKVRIVIQGRKFKGYRTAQDLGHGLFGYRGHVYDSEDFPALSTVNLDKTRVDPIGYLSPHQGEKKKKKKKAPKHSLNAVLYSNAEDCPDVQEILRTQ